MQIHQFDEAEIRELINEVSKEKPNHNRVKALVKKYDIQFSTDPIEQMTFVLQKIDTKGLGRFSKNLEIKES